MCSNNNVLKKNKRCTKFVYIKPKRRVSKFLAFVPHIRDNARLIVSRPWGDAINVIEIYKFYLLHHNSITSTVISHRSTVIGLSISRCYVVLLGIYNLAWTAPLRITTITLMSSLLSSSISIKKNSPSYLVNTDSRWRMFTSLARSIWKQRLNWSLRHLIVLALHVIYYYDWFNNANNLGRAFYFLFRTHPSFRAQ